MTGSAPPASPSIATAAPTPDGDDEPTATREKLRSLGDILNALDQTESDAQSVTVDAVMQEIGDRSFAPLLLVPAMILVSPLSGIPGLPTIGAILMLLITGQKIAGRPHVWLPGWLKRRHVGIDKIHRATRWLKRPAEWVDRHTHKRLPWLVTRPSNVITVAAIMAICLLIPFLEILPMVTSFFATAIVFYAIGLLARDGLFTLLGHIWVAGAASLVIWLMGG